MQAVDYVRRLSDLTVRHRQERELDTERLCAAQQQAERFLEVRERSHRQQVKALEQQVSLSFSLSLSPLSLSPSLSVSSLLCLSDLFAVLN